MASIQNLDPPCLLNILNRLSIQKLLTAGHVCVRWNELRLNSARSRKQLTLLIGNDAQRCIDEYESVKVPVRRLLVDENGDLMFPDNDQNAQLQIHSFPHDFVRFLCTHFDNLTTLTISTRLNSDEIDSIIHLLEQFNRPNGTLQSLKLYSGHHRTVQNTNNIKKKQTPKFRAYLQLLSAVNSIGSLLKLAFNVNVKFNRSFIHPRIDLPILAQLEQFEFNSADEQLSCLYDSISSYAVNNQRLRRIDIHFSTKDFTWLLALPTELSARFTHLRLRLTNRNDALYENLCLHFVHLTSLDITFNQDNFTIFTLFRPLIHMTNLISLVLRIDDFTLNLSSVPPNEQGVMHFELPSVKVFTIKLISSISNLDCHNFFHHCNINRIFPNVQIVRVFRMRSLCRNCTDKIEARWSLSDLIALEEHCARHMFRHFAHCQSLRMVCSKIEGTNVHGILYRQWMWNELEPFVEEEEGEGEVEELEELEELEEIVPEYMEEGTLDDPILIDETSEKDEEEDKEKGTLDDPIQIDEI